MRRRASALVPLLALCVLASCAAYFKANHDLYTGDLIKIPHARHKKAGVDCIVCHDGVYDATTLAGSFRPAEADCLQCHQEEKDKGNCAFCHTDVKRAGPYPRRDPELLFNHAAHLPRVKQDCTSCHTTLPDGPLPVRKPGDAPTMAGCQTCHEHKDQIAAGRCEACHVDLHRYRLEPVASFTHGGNYVKLHGRDARSATDSCQKCHEQTFCTDCHAATVSTRIEIKQSEQVDRDFIHRNDWLGRHSLEAAADQTTCRRCHGSTFCVGCHTAQNLTETSVDPRSPHPPGFSWPGSPNNHGPLARRDIARCASCHDQGPRSNCITCHSVGGIGGDPHPPGFSDHHSAAEARQNGMCLYCHR